MPMKVDRGESPRISPTTPSYMLTYIYTTKEIHKK